MLNQHLLAQSDEVRGHVFEILDEMPCDISTERAGNVAAWCEFMYRTAIEHGVQPGTATGYRLRGMIADLFKALNT